MPLRTIARITAFRPGQSPPPVRTPMRIEPGTYIARAARPAAVLLVFLAGCSGGAQAEAKPPPRPLKVYMSAPLPRFEARAGQAATAGAHLALSGARER